jgi:hypothetical protein
MLHFQSVLSKQKFPTKTYLCLAVWFIVEQYLCESSMFYSMWEHYCFFFF